MRKIVINLLLILILAVADLKAATIKAAQAGNWSDTATWIGGVVPGNGDTADCNGLVIVMDIGTIPATGTLLALTSPATAGQLTVNLAAVGARTINATTIQAGTVVGFIKVSGTAYTLTINCDNLYGGSGASAWGVWNTSTGAVTVNGNVTGGSAGTAYGIYNGGTGTITIIGNTIGGSNMTAYGIWNNSTGVVTITGNLIFSNYAPPYVGYRPVLTAGSQYYIEMAGIKFPQQLLAHQVLADVNHGGLMGTRIDCPVAKAVSTSGKYGDPANPLVGIYHEPDANEVWHTAVFGANSEVNGTKVASSIANCEAANIKNGVIIDDVNGTFLCGIPGGE